MLDLFSRDLVPIRLKPDDVHTILRLFTGAMKVLLVLVNFLRIVRIAIGGMDRLEYVYLVSTI